MGRSALHFSASEKAAASRQSSLKHSQKLSVKQQRSERTTSVHRRKGARKHASLSSAPPPSSAMLEEAALPLPQEHHLYQQALASPDALDESDLQRWKSAPPFVADNDDSDRLSMDYLSYTSSLSAVLHGVRLREQRERDLKLRQAFRKRQRTAALSSLTAEVVRLHLDWEAAQLMLQNEHYHPVLHPRELSMLKHHCHWVARTIVHLHGLKFLE
ncbi:unnamed protein product [Mycena citricolor]|uniref:Uncharacterized protein n=1 Tax=Mycena citricolor TaxID=2018698 RepID=A0AAD2H733_9AGAR|nr:unnamed protein product [Mycena citricolor]